MNDFIRKLEELNLFLVVDKNDLILRGRKGKLTAVDKERIQQDESITEFIKGHKQELISYLKNNGGANESNTSMYPLSPMQEAMLFHGLFDVSSRAYVDQLVIPFTILPDVAVLRTVLNELAKRHTILRTRFVIGQSDKPVQSVQSAIDLPLEVIDFSEDTEDKENLQFTRLLSAERERGFDLETPPLLRAVFVNLGDNQYRLVITYHHILMDGRSTALLLEELFLLYERIRDGSPLPKSVDDYYNYIKYLSGRNVVNEKTFWTKYLEDLRDDTTLPFLKAPFSSGFLRHARTQKQSAGRQRTIDIKQFAMANRVTVNTIAQTAWALLLSFYTGRTWNAFGVTLSTRPPDIPAIANRIGLYINTIPSYEQVTADAQIASLLSRIQQNHSEAKEFQDASLSEIKSWIGYEGAIYDSIFVFDSSVREEQERITERARRMGAGGVQSYATTNYPLTIFVRLDDVLSIELSYYEETLYDTHARHILNEFVETIGWVISNPHQRAGDLFKFLKQHNGLSSADRSFWRSHFVNEIGRVQLPTDYNCSSEDTHSQKVGVSTREFDDDASAITDQVLFTAIVVVTCKLLDAFEFNVALRGKENDSYLVMPVQVKESHSIAALKKILADDLELFKKYPVETDRSELHDRKGAISIDLEDCQVRARLPVHDIHVSVRRNNGKIVLNASFDETLFERTTVDVIQDAIFDTVDYVIKNPGKSIGEVPLDKTLEQWKRAVKSSRQNLSLFASFNIDPFLPYFRRLCEWSNARFTITHRSYSKLIYELSDRSSSFYEEDIRTVVFIRWEDFHAEGRELIDSIKENSRAFLDLLETSLDDIRNTLVTVCVPSRKLANQAEALDLMITFGDQLKALCRNSPHVEVVNMAEALELYDLDEKLICEAGQLNDYGVAFNEHGYAVLAIACWRKLYQSLHAPYKVIAVDCDNTLWGGVCAEVGPAGVRLSTEYLSFQTFLKSQKEAGMLLALCSQNVPADVDSVFNENTAMILSKKDFVIEKVNWNNKAANLEDISSQLGVSPASIIFIDDDPLQRSSVRKQIPSVNVFDMPTDEKIIAKRIRRSWLFDQGSSALKVDRTQSYKNNEQRKFAGLQASDRDAYLKELQLVIDIEDVNTGHYERVVEMCQRVTQFNITNTRYDVGKLTGFFTRSGNGGFVVSMRDKFGDYGIIGLSLYEIVGSTLNVRAFLVSCRALGRGVEFRIVNRLGEMAVSRGAGLIDFNFMATSRNEPARSFLESLDAFAAVPVTTALNAKAGSPIRNNVERVNIPISYSERLKDPLKLASSVLDVNELITVVNTARVKRVSRRNGGSRPAGALEKSLASIFEELLGVSDVLADDNFFRLGGHSLLATRLISSIKYKLGVDVDLKSVFECKTVSSLAAHVQKKRDYAGVKSIRVKTERQACIPLSFAQERLWFIDRLQGSTNYHIPIALRIHGVLDLGALNDAFMIVIERHEIFRTTYHENDDGTVCQRVGEATGWHIDLKELPNDKSFNEWFAEFALTPFDLSSDSIIRVTMLQHSPTEFILAIVIHHIGFDAWSHKILIDEVTELYNARVNGRAAALVDVHLQYADYSQWQHDGREAIESIEYWKSKLADLPVPVLPLDHPRPPVQSINGAMIKTGLDSERTLKLTHISLNEDSTLFATIFTAFNILVARFSGSNDVCIGIPVANRGEKEIENTIGFFANTLPVRSVIPNDARFVDALSVIKATTLEAFQHQGVPFERIVSAVVKERDLSRSPLFSVMFNMLDDTVNYVDRMEGLTVSELPFDPHTTLYDLMMQVRTHANGLDIILHYCSDLFTEITARRILDTFKGLLISVASNPLTRISDLHLLPASDEERLKQFNDTDQFLGSNGTVITLFKDQVRLNPQCPAVECSQNTLTYLDLDRKSDELAIYLEYEASFERGSKIAVMLDRCCDIAVCIYGILKAGCVYVPIDPAYPENRIRYIIENSQASVILTGEGGWVPEEYTNMQFCLNDLEPSRYQNSKDVYRIDHHDASYIIYTSGSTGNPKGVVQTHRTLYNLVCWDMARSRLRHNSRYLQFSSFCFDSSIHDILYATATGGTAIIVPEEARRDMWMLKDLVLDRGVNTISMPYSALKNFFDNFSSADLQGHSITEIISTGEQLYINGGLRDFLTANINTRLFNFYGPSETHVVTSTSYSFSEGGDVPVVASIGKPIDNTFIYILDQGRRQVPIGVVGEIYIGGYNLAAGYLRNHEETSRRFVHGSDLPVSGILYRTGDLARWKDNGDIDFLGRTDNQLKIRGYRLELDEVESMLQRSPGIVRGTVIASKITRDQLETTLVAYVVLAHGATIKDVEDFMRSALPGYMLPSLYVALTHFPTTSNGKIDKSVLPSPVFSERETFVAPSSETEKKLADIWSRILSIPRDTISVTSSFFSLGGHSLLVTRMSSALRRDLSVVIPIKLLFHLSSIRALAEYIDLLVEAGDNSNTTPNHATPDYDYFDL